MTKDERRAAARTSRERMMAGDEKYLLPRDRGKVRAYVRDLVDTRRNMAGILLPIALLSFVILLVPMPVVQAYGPLVLLVAIVAAVIDSVIFGRQIWPRRSRRSSRTATAPGQSTKGSSLGFYAFNRACLIRRWRVPRPRVETGDARSTDPGTWCDDLQRAAAANADAVLRRFFDAEGRLKHAAGQAVPAAGRVRPDRPAVRPRRPVHRDRGQPGADGDLRRLRQRCAAGWSTSA